MGMAVLPPRKSMQYDGYAFYQEPESYQRRRAVHAHISQDDRRYPSPLPALAYMCSTFEDPSALSFFSTQSFTVINLLCVSASWLPLSSRLSQPFS